MKAFRILSAALVLVFLLAGPQAQQRPNSASSQSRRGRAPATTPPDQAPPPAGQMSPQHQQMIAKLNEMTQFQSELLDQLNKADAELQKKVDAMNAAAGDKKIAAMADVLTEMAQERKQLHAQVMALQKEVYEQTLTQIRMSMMMMTSGRTAPGMHDMGTTGTMGGMPHPPMGGMAPGMMTMPPPQEK